jgi:hypothetical protein
MAAEAQRAPRLARGLTSMAAAVASGAAAKQLIETDMTAAWAAVFQACGGVMTVDDRGRQAIAFAQDFAPISEIIGTTPISLVTPDERRGALKALGAVLDLCDAPTRGDIFAFANLAVGEG